MLGRHWEPGQATIITSEGNYLFQGGTGCGSREYVVDVQPAAGGPRFRTKINVQYTAPEGGAQEPYRRLLDDEVVPVQCDQKRQKAKFDESTLRAAVPGADASGPFLFEAAASAPPGTPAQIVGGAQPATAGSDPLERLQELAALHDRGVLTDAEFAAEKAKILGES